MHEDDLILVKHSGDLGVVRVEGRGTFKNARYLKTFAKKSREIGINQFALDLGKCTHMDSTFMGTIAGLAIDAKKSQTPLPQVYYISEKNLELLQTLGLDRILNIVADDLKISADGKTDSKEDAEDKINQEQLSEDMLEAHQTLASLSESNAEKFEDVIHFLRNKLETSEE
ncbi:MAG: STAS domain-containing protein [Verrucomicrobiota bacterium]